jgi:hypothetical protein
MGIKYTKWHNNIPNGHKIYQNLLLQDTPKFTQIGIFCLKICHLATLPYTLAGFDRTTHSSSHLRRQAETIPLDHAARAHKCFVKMAKRLPN